MKKFFVLICIVFGMLTHSVSDAQVLISGFLANPPTNNDAPYEYVQLIATKNIDFSSTNFCIVWANNGAASPDGWIQGGTVTYGFNITSGTVTKGEVFYVGGDGKMINGSGSTDLSTEKWLRAINTSTTTGDGFGTNGPTGQLGNGGTNADGIAVFTGTAQNLTASSIPVDAVFYGSGIGTAIPTPPLTGGYTLPDNDRYSNSQGTFGNGTNTFLFPNPNLTGNYLKLSGTYFPSSEKWDVQRTGRILTLTLTSPVSTINTGITLSDPMPKVLLSATNSGGLYIAQNSSNNVLHSFKIEVQEMDAMLDTFKIRLGGTFTAADFKNIKLIYSKDAVYDVTDVVVKSLNTVSSGTLSFDSVALSLDSASVGYLLITLDVASAATNNNTIYMDSAYFKDFIFQSVKFTGFEPLPSSGTLTITVAGAAIIQSTFINSFGSVDVGATSAEQVFTISGSNLSPASGNVMVIPAAGFRVSFTSGGGYSSTTITKAYTSSTLSNVKVYVVFKPTAYTTYNSNLTIGGGGASPVYIPVNGTGACSDFTAPVVDTAYAVSSTKIKVIFTEAVSNSAETISNYTINTGVTAAVRTASFDTVYLTLTNALPVATNVNLTIRNIQDTCINHNQMTVPQFFVVRYGTIVIRNYAIKDINSENATTGQADSLNVYCRLTGVIQSINFSQNTNNSLFYIHDNTGGIQVNRGGAIPPFVVVRGDRVRVMGRIQQLNGLTRLQADSIVVIESGQQERAPATVKILDESTESEVVQLNDVWLTNPVEWPTTAGGTRNVNVTDGINNFVITIFTRCDIQGTPAPGGTFDIIGIGSQNDNSLPYLQSYTIWPRDINDLILAPPHQTYNIAQVHTENVSTGIADSIGLYCRLVGVVHGNNESTTGGLSFTIIDKTGGIKVFNYVNVDPPYFPFEGDEVAVVGSIMQYDGLTEIYPDSVTFLTSGNPTVSPVVTDVLNETTESQLVQIKNLSIVPPSQWPVVAVKTIVDVEVTDGAHNFIVRIYPGCDIQGTPAPAGKFNITGIGAQFDQTDPFLENYYIIPRYQADVTLYSGINDAVELTGVSVYPNPATDYFFFDNITGSKISVEIFNTYGQLIYQTTTTQAHQKISLASNKGLYLLKLTDLNSMRSKTLKVELN